MKNEYVSSEFEEKQKPRRNRRGFLKSIYLLFYINIPPHT